MTDVVAVVKGWQKLRIRQEICTWCQGLATACLISCLNVGVNGVIVWVMLIVGVNGVIVWVMLIVDRFDIGV